LRELNIDLDTSSDILDNMIDDKYQKFIEEIKKLRDDVYKKIEELAD